MADCAGEKISEVAGCVKWSSVDRFMLDFYHGSLALYKSSSSYYIHGITAVRRGKFPFKPDKVTVVSRGSRLTMHITQDANKCAVSIHLKDAAPNQLQLFLDSLNNVRTHFPSIQGALPSSSASRSDIQSVESRPSNSNDLSPTVTAHESPSRSNLAASSPSQNTTKDKTASSVEIELEKHLKCAICLGKFEDPKVLKCQHLYCKKCLERLVTKVGREKHKISCPECREKTEVPNGDVARLPSNFVVNNLLSIRGNGQSNAGPPCEKHDGEILKLFCQTCDKLICRDCIVIDHRDHKYTFVKDIFPAEKEKVLKIVEESKVNIRALESSIEAIKTQKDGIQKNCQNVTRKLDSFTNKQIELLERKRQSLRDQLWKSVRGQTESLDAQMESFVLSLGCLKSSLEFIEEALNRGSEVEVLSARQQLNEQNSATLVLNLRGRIYYRLEVDSQFNYDTFEKIAKIREDDEEYEFGIVDGLGELKRLDSVDSSADQLTNFSIRPKSSSSVDFQNEVQVEIIAPDADHVHFQPDVTSNSDGSFSFSYNPEGNVGDYKIEALVNGRYVHGSPFNWVVSKSFKRRMLQKSN
ncbi:hypothetical protein ACROYT_G035068 [Oculina patagonica]